MVTIDDIVELFEQHNIDMRNPGFYDNINFMKIEQIDPSFLINYASFVQFNKYSNEYFEFVKAKVPAIVNMIYDRFNKENGKCIDLSNILLKLIEKEGIWAYMVKGSVQIIFPKKFNIDKKYFYSIDIGDFMAGHAWIVAPPYQIIDLTLKHQSYKCGEEKYLPDYIISTNCKLSNYNANEIINESYVPSSYTADKFLAEYLLSNKGMDFVLNNYPTYEYKYCGLRIKYIPVGIAVPDTSLEDYPYNDIIGCKPIDFYNEMRNKYLKNLNGISYQL